MVSLSHFFGRSVGEGAGVAIGTATAEGVEPALEQFGNTMREHFRHKAIDPQDAAALRARESLPGYPGIDLGAVDPSHEARYGGLRGARFDALTELAREHPSIGELLELRRRRLALGGDAGIDVTEFREWMRRTGYTAEIIDALTKLLVQYLAPADVANAVQQGFVPNDGILPDADLHGGPYTVPSEQQDIDPVAEAAIHGYDKQRLKVLAELSGNPPGPMELLEMWNRGIITEGDVERGIREGRTKTKWIDALKQLKRELLSPSTLVNLVLRGWYTEAEIAPRMALHGYTAEQLHDWFLSAGRPAAPGQMATAVARGIDGPDGRPMDKAQFVKGIRESDIRPEWADMLWDSRFLYPPLFQLTRLVQGGAIDADTAADWARKDRYPPEVVNALHTYWSQATVVKADPNVSKAETQLWTTLHRSYVATESDDAAVEADLGLLGVPQGVHARILNLWQHERELIRKQLTPAQIKKAWKKPVVNPATGANWTRDDALAALVARGYSLNDANTFLDE